MADSVGEVFTSLEVDVAAELAACEEALAAAVSRAREEAGGQEPDSGEPTGRPGDDE